MNYQRPVVLVFISTYLPGFKAGGPIRSISNLISALGDEFDFRVVTTDRDFLSNRAYENVTHDVWSCLGKAKVLYLQPQAITLKRIKTILKSVDANYLYLNSFYSTSFTLKVLIAKFLLKGIKCKVILAPRGEFSAGALSIKSLKKKTYIFLTKRLGIYRNILWQASSLFEKNDIIKIFGIKEKDIVVAPNLTAKVDDIDFSSSKFKSLYSSESLNVNIIARISAMKNFDFCLQVLKRVDCRVNFSIYGTAEDSVYLMKCEKLAKELPSNVIVEFKGQLNHSEVRDVLLLNDLYFLPTRGENFGHSIFEAFSAGLPVLISNQTPWRNLEKKALGWDLDLNDVDAFVSSISYLFKQSKADGFNQRRLVLEFAKEISTDVVSIEKNRALFC